jgi:hypothetical protein
MAGIGPNPPFAAVQQDARNGGRSGRRDSRDQPVALIRRNLKLLDRLFDRRLLVRLVIDDADELGWRAAEQTSFAPRSLHGPEARRCHPRNLASRPARQSLWSTATAATRLGFGARLSGSPAARATGTWPRSRRRRSGSGPSMPLGGSDKTAKIAAAINARVRRNAPQSACCQLWISSFLSRRRHATLCCLINLTLIKLPFALPRAAS